MRLTDLMFEAHRGDGTTEAMHVCVNSDGSLMAYPAERVEGLRAAKVGGVAALVENPPGGDRPATDD